MGNEESQYNKLEIDDKSIEVTDNWSLFYAKDSDGNIFDLSAFVGQVNPADSSPTPLEKFGKNLMIHRHPCIVKYISSWNRHNKFHLITEKVQPLSLVLPHQSALQICVGLHSVLRAIIFLHEKAQSSHNNVCCASVYVTPEGVWKLGGLEYQMKFENITPTFLKETRKTRYEKAVPPEEDSVTTNAKVNASAIDKYAFGVMVEELLKKKTNNEVPFLMEFLDYCKKQLQTSNPGNRVNLSEVLQHPFFNHDFIRIYKFLCDLPLKTSNEKEQFFSELTEQLYLLPEDVVACQLTSLLLSRVVLLDSTAQKHLLPVLLQPKTDDKLYSAAIFSTSIFKKYIVPKLLNIFCVRDAQIRIILLNNFHLFCHMFTTEQQKDQVLPELLVGIKDVNDQLVSITLKALSQLVLILGASTVIGGKRGKLFTDGRPKSHVSQPPVKSKGVSKPKISQSPLKSSSDILFANNGLPERPSPDGGEDKSSSSSAEEGDGGEAEHWSDWDLQDEKNSPGKISREISSVTEGVTEIPVKSGEGSIKREDSEITFLDIKSSTSENAKGGDIDFFHDMEPVISKTQTLSIKPSKTKFDIESDEPGTNWDGWGEDWELGDIKI